MPFSGGGGGQLTNHVHDNTPLQGGPLNFNNTTIAGMNAGDITFSDGAALQTLTYPAVPANETLTAVALSTAPTWVAAAAATGTFELVDTVELTGTATFIDSSFASISGADISCILIEYDLQLSNVATDFNLQYGTGGGLVTSNYYTKCFNMTTTTTIATGALSHWLLSRNPNYRHISGTARFYVADPSIVAANTDMTFSSMTVDSNPDGQICAGSNFANSDSIDQVRISVGAGSLQIGSKMSVYRLNRT